MTRPGLPWFDECAGCGEWGMCDYEASSGAYSLCVACELTAAILDGQAELEPLPRRSSMMVTIGYGEIRHVHRLPSGSANRPHIFEVNCWCDPDVRPDVASSVVIVSHHRPALFDR
ncbi:MAG: hypothetical protein OXM88_09260 [bacterium]|nr:hypothetical protein [bacterium]